MSQPGSLVGIGGGGRGGEEAEVRSGVEVDVGAFVVGLEVSLGAILGMMWRVQGAAELLGGGEKEYVSVYIYMSGSDRQR